METSLFRLLAAALLSCSSLAQSTWHLRYTLPDPNSEPGHGLLGITYADGLYVAVGFRQTVLTSTNAVTWTSRLPESDTTFTAIGDPTSRIRGETGPTSPCRSSQRTALIGRRRTRAWPSSPPGLLNGRT
jgi:hypothetical protein